MEISTYLKQIRKSKKLTQFELAKKIGCSSRQIIRWETNSSDITFAMLEKLAIAVDMKINPNLFIENDNKI